MSRPWYVYPLMAAGALALLIAVFRPVGGSNRDAPGGLLAPDGRLILVTPDGPLARAGLRVGDRFLHGERIYAGAAGAAGSRLLKWARDLPDPNPVEFERAGERLTREVRPIPPHRPLRVAWWLLSVLNVALVALGLALIWQRGRELPALLLGLTLLSAPVFSFPGKPRVFFVVLAAHFFAMYASSLTGRVRRGWGLAAGIWVPFLLLGFVGLSSWGSGQWAPATRWFDLLAVAYSVFGVSCVLRERHQATAEQRPVFGSLLVAAGAVLTAAAAAAWDRLWWSDGQLLPVNAVPAAVFGATLWVLVFRLKVLQVRVITRRTLQYLLARWTLGTLFLIPGFLLVFNFGQISVSHQSVKPGTVIGYVVWMVLAAVLLGKRQTVLRNLDRRFFRDPDTTRQALVRLAQELGRQTDPVAVLATLESGVREAVHPLSIRYTLPDVPPDPEAALSVPIRRGEGVLGNLQLGPKESGAAYTDEEGGLLEAAAVQAALAIENTRLSAALFARQRAELTARTTGVLAGAEEERRRLAADLHDQVLPELRQIAADVDRLKAGSNGQAPDLERLGEEVRGTMDSVREVMEALRPSALDMLGLGFALESYLRKGAARLDPPIAVSVRRVGEEPELSPDQSLALYRICQEAMNNLLKHSGAGRAGLEIRNEQGFLRLVIWDDGGGCDLEESLGMGHGLSNIRYRADLAGAGVAWERPEAGGTRVVVSLPLTAVLPPAALPAEPLLPPGPAALPP